MAAVACADRRGVAVSYYRGTIDLINASAAALVVFICLWIVSGSMDRLNIAMMFAMMSLATLSVTRWRQLVAINFAVQLPIYACVAARLREPQWFFGSEIPDAAATTVFVVSYFALLLLPRGDAAMER
jgi:hypothetical protein